MKELENQYIANKPKIVSGFTLIEVMIVCAIIGILATIVYPSYREFVVSSNRSEATQELVRFANLQEQLFVDTRAYTDDISELGVGADASFTTQSGNYIISSVIVNTSFTLTATAQGNQAKDDTACVAITLNDTGAKAPGMCWEE
jgi:type IV pilus assembly protein PilE